MTTHRDQPATRRQPGDLSPRRQATRERILDAAVQLFAERGVLAASVEEICDRAGFTRGAFYSNYETKNDLCLDLLRRKGELYLAAVQAAIEVIPETPGMDGPERLIHDAVSVFLEAQPKQPAELVTMMELRLHAVRTPELRDGWLAVHDSIQESVAGLGEIAMARVGVTLAMPTADVVELLGAVYESTVSMSLLRGESAPTGLGEQLAALLNAFIVGDC